MASSEVFRHGHAVVIGVGADLPATARDAMGVRDQLVSPRRCAYPIDQVQMLTDGMATRAKILEALDDLAVQCALDPEATAIVFYSGHGGHRVGDDTYFLVPNGFSWSDFDQTAIMADEFIAKVASVRPKRLLVLLDCCHAGSFADAKGFAHSPPPRAFLEQLRVGEGRAVVASSRGRELSYAGNPYSVFTAALLEGLAGYGSSRHEGFAELFDVLRWIGEVVPQRTDGRQNPVLSSEAMSLSFPLAYYAGGATRPKALPWSSLRPSRAARSREDELTTEEGRIIDGLAELEPGQFQTIVTKLGINPANLEGNSQAAKANSLLRLAQQRKKRAKLRESIEDILTGWFEDSNEGPR